MSIRLLFLTAETYPTFRVDVNVLFGKVLPQYGIQSDLVTGKTPGETNAEAWEGGETYLCDVSTSSSKKHIQTFIHGIKHLVKADTSRYQAIQVRDMPLLATVGLIVARLKGLKFFYWMSYPMPEAQILLAGDRGWSEGLIKFIYPWLSGRVGRFLLYKIVIPRADHIFVQSDQMKEDLVKRGTHPQKMTPVPMGVDTETLQNIDIHPTDDSRLDGKRVLVYLGILEYARKINILFEALAIVKQQIPNILLVLVGDTYHDADREWLKSKADEAGVNDQLVWTGWLPMHEGWRYVRAAELGLSPIPRGFLLDCGSPTKVPEYLALGVPVVCNDNPDQEQVINKSGAGLCVPYSAENFANAIIKMLNLDKAEKNKMQIQGKDYVDHFRSYRKIGDNVANSYQNLLSKKIATRMIDET